MSESTIPITLSLCYYCCCCCCCCCCCYLVVSDSLRPSSGWAWYRARHHHPTRSCRYPRRSGRGNRLGLELYRINYIILYYLFYYIYLYTIRVAETRLGLEQRVADEGGRCVCPAAAQVCVCVCARASRAAPRRSRSAPCALTHARARTHTHTHTHRTWSACASTLPS